MTLFLLILLVVLAVTGTLTFVLKVALGVALGVILGIALVGALVGWRVRRTLFGPRGRSRQSPGSSRVEVLDPRDLPPRHDSPDR
jgi:heme A synthase